MLADANHSGWRNEIYERELTAYLGTSAEACIITFEAIQVVVEQLSRRVTTFTSSIPQAPPKSILNKVAQSDIAKKLKFSFLSSEIDEQMKDLRKLNRDLESLAKQIYKKEPSGSAIGPKKNVIQSKKDLKTFRMVQAAAKTLYETLGEACTKHTEHKSHICLEPRIDRSDNMLINFDLAYRQSSYDLNSSAEKAIWFCVETTLRTQVVTSTPATSSSVHSILSALQPRESYLTATTTTTQTRAAHSPLPADLSTPKRRKRNVTFEDAKPLPSPQALTIPDFLKDPDLCTRILAVLRRQSIQERCCIGSLQRDINCSSLIYLPRSHAATMPRNAMSLTQILTTLEKRKLTGHLSQYERARFARLLAVAAMQFHSTPWLKSGAWRTDDLVLFDFRCDDDESKLPTLTSPYMDVSVQKRDQNSPAPAIEARPGIRNPLIFGLALLLIQLAFERPLTSMRLGVDQRYGKGNVDVEFATAERMTRVIGAEMGERYKRLVEKCLFNNFGVPGTVEDDSFQEKYYTDVVCELEALEKIFQGLDLEDRV